VKPTETVEFWKQKAREQEKRAKENADAAKRLSQLEEQNKSDVQKAIDRAEAAEQALAAKEAETLRLTIASKHGISGEYLDLLSGADEDELEAKAQKVASLIESQQAPRKGPVIPEQGDTPTNSAGAGESEFARTLFSGE
jgi:hypothetical protein